MSDAMRLMVIAVVLMLSVSGCRSMPEPCLGSRNAELLRTVVSWDWSALHSQDAFARWPGSLEDYDLSATPDTTCSGMLLLRRFEDISRGMCRCCLTFEFARQPDEPGCPDRLTGIVIDMTLPSEETARRAVGDLYAVLSIPPVAVGHARSAALAGQGATHAWQDGTIQSSVASRIRRTAPEVWHVRVAYTRHSRTPG